MACRACARLDSEILLAPRKASMKMFPKLREVWPGKLWSLGVWVIAEIYDANDGVEELEHLSTLRRGVTRCVNSQLLTKCSHQHLHRKSGIIFTSIQLVEGRYKILRGLPA